MGKKKRNSELPDRIKDPILGGVRFSVALDGMDEYEAKVKIGGHRVSINLYTDENGEIQPCIVRARKIVERFPAIPRKMRRYIEKNIYPTYNEVWRPNQKAVTFEQLMGKLKLSHVTTQPEPEATFWLDAGNLFLGHSLRLMMARRNRFVDHDMPG